MYSFTSSLPTYSCFFFFNDTATTEIYTLSLHDALPIYPPPERLPIDFFVRPHTLYSPMTQAAKRSEEHTSELQSRLHLVCRLLLEKKKKNTLKHSTCIVASLLHTLYDRIPKSHKSDLFS